VDKYIVSLSASYVGFKNKGKISNAEHAFRVTYDNTRAFALRVFKQLALYSLYSLKCSLWKWLLSRDSLLIIYIN